MALLGARQAGLRLNRSRSQSRRIAQNSVRAFNSRAGADAEGRGKSAAEELGAVGQQTARWAPESGLTRQRRRPARRRRLLGTGAATRFAGSDVATPLARSDAVTLFAAVDATRSAAAPAVLAWGRRAGNGHNRRLRPRLHLSRKVRRELLSESARQQSPSCGRQTPPPSRSWTLHCGRRGCCSRRCRPATMRATRSIEAPRCRTYPTPYPPGCSRSRARV